MFADLLSGSAVLAQGYKFSQTAVNVTKLADRTAASIRFVKKIAIECLPPQIKYPLKYTIFFLQCGVVFYSPAKLIPSATAFAVAAVNQIAEAMLNDL